jgi:hypothetical protein
MTTVFSHEVPEEVAEPESESVVGVDGRTVIERGGLSMEGVLEFDIVFAMLLLLLLLLEL